MKLPTWETSPGALVAFLDASSQVYSVDLYTITLSGGAVIRYTAADLAAVVNGITFAIGPVIKRGNTSVSVGVSVDSLDGTISADSTVLVGSVPLLQFIAGGGFDGATMLVERAFSSAPGAAWVGTLGMFKGRIGPQLTSRYESQLTINSDSELLNVMIPRNVYQPGCVNTLYDAACGMPKATMGASATASSATDTAQTTFSTAGTYTASMYALGFAVCITGANAGVQRTIKSNTAHSVTTIQPWPAAVAVSDTFKFYPGCDKTKSTCATKFSNLVRFRGFPFVPSPESVT